MFQKIILTGIALIGMLGIACMPLKTSLLTEIPTSYGDETGPAPVQNRNKPGGGQDCCRDPLNYAPDTNHLDHTPMKYVRVNFHLMYSADSLYNFPRKEAIYHTAKSIRDANRRLEKNPKMLLPLRNDTPVLPVRHRFVLEPDVNGPDSLSIYFHYDDTLYYYIVRGRQANLGDKRVINKYGVKLDTVLNIFMMPHHPDSVASKTYKAYGTGVALGNATKIAGSYELKIHSAGTGGTLSHEVAHIFGLSHTWAYNDGCDDTPLNPNCWSPSLPGCDSTTSNNVMDYNVFQAAWTPCQIGKFQYSIANENNSVRRLVEPRWCDLHEDATITITDSVHWKSMKDLEGNLVIAPGGRLKMSCRTSLPKGAKITVQPGGRLYLDNCQLHNACGDTWGGIEIQEKGKLKGEVVFIGKPIIEDIIEAMGN